MHQLFENLIIVGTPPDRIHTLKAVILFQNINQFKLSSCAVLRDLIMSVLTQTLMVTPTRKAKRYFDQAGTSQTLRFLEKETEMVSRNMKSCINWGTVVAPILHCIETYYITQ